MSHAETNRGKLDAIAPQFLVDDLKASLAYYTEKLGFEHYFTYGDFYAGVRRDDVPIHLKCAPKTKADRLHRRTHEHLDAYIAVSGVDALHEEMKRRGADIFKSLEDRPWGVRDFYVADADGYILCFSG